MPPALRAATEGDMLPMSEIRRSPAHFVEVHLVVVDRSFAQPCSSSHDQGILKPHILAACVFYDMKQTDVGFKTSTCSIQEESNLGPFFCQPHFKLGGSCPSFLCASFRRFRNPCNIPRAAPATKKTSTVFLFPFGCS